MGFYLIILFCIRLLFCSSDLIDQKSIKLEYNNLDKQVEKILSNLSLEQKIGQMLIYGFHGRTAAKNAIPLIDKYNVGGFIVFTHNIKNEKQLVALTRDIRLYSLHSIKVPAFIAIDQEGGKVLRIKSFGTVLPGNMNLGAARSSTLSFLAGKLTAIDLEMLGINMNFAPVLDVNISPDNDVIGVRSFSDDPKIVSKLGSAYIRGIQSRRVSATAKHFPGHGSTKGDSHYGILTVNHNWDLLKKIDLHPFMEAINEGVDAVMTAHIALPKIDPSGSPATLSKKIITGVLRNALGFDGLVITDDLEMKSIAKNSIEAAAVKAVLAGCDIITIAWTDSVKRRVYSALLRAARSNIITEDRINKSVRRILRVKIKRKLFKTNPDPNIEEIKRIVGNRFHQQIARLIARKSITMVRNLKNVVPVSKGGRVVVLSSFVYLSSELNRFGLISDLIKMNTRLNRDQKITILNKALKHEGKVDAYIVAVIDESQAQVAKLLKQYSNKPVIVAALDSPYVYSTVKDVDAYLCVYSFRSQAIRALAKVISGDEKALGKLPVDLTSPLPEGKRVSASKPG